MRIHHVDGAFSGKGSDKRVADFQEAGVHGDGGRRLPLEARIEEARHPVGIVGLDEEFALGVGEEEVVGWEGPLVGQVLLRNPGGKAPQPFRAGTGAMQEVDKCLAEGELVERRCVEQREVALLGGGFVEQVRVAGHGAQPLDDFVNVALRQERAQRVGAQQCLRLCRGGALVTSLVLDKAGVCDALPGGIGGFEQ